MKEVVKRWLISLGVSLVLTYGSYRVYHAYSHFEWIHTRTEDGKVYAVPAFVK